MVDPVNLIKFFYNWGLSWKKRKGGIYGAVEVGKSTLQSTMKRDGFLPESIPNTVGVQHPTKYKIEVKGSDKKIRNRTTVICDTTGELEHVDLLKMDMWLRELDYVIIMIDHTHITMGDQIKPKDKEDAARKNNNIKMVDAIIEAIIAKEQLVPKWGIMGRYIKTVEKTWKPKCVAVCINKLDEITMFGLEIDKIIDPIEESLRKLSGIHNSIFAVSALKKRTEGNQYEEMFDWIFRKIEE